MPLISDRQNLVEEASLVDCVIGCWEIGEHNTSLPFLPQNNSRYSEIEHVASCGFHWVEACLFCDEVFIYCMVTSSKNKAFE